MANSDVTVRFLGDTSSLDKATSRSQNAATKLGTAFQDVGQQIGGELGDVVSKFGAGIEGIGRAAQSTGAKLTAIGIGALALGTGLQALGSKDQAAQQQLQAAITATGNTWDDYKGRVEDAIKSGENFGRNAVETQNALQTLTAATNSPAKALQYLQVTFDLAAARHIELSDAANLVAKALNGNKRLLTQYGITVADVGTKAQQGANGVNQLASKLSGQAAASVNTFTGHLDILRAKLGDAVAQFAGPVGSALNNFGGVAAAVGLILQSKLIGRMKASIGAADGFAGKFAALGKIAGPAAIALGAGAAIFDAMAQHAQEAKNEVDAFTQALIADGGKIGSAVRSQIIDQLASNDAYAGSIDAAHQLGLTTTDLINAILGQKSAVGAVNDATSQHVILSSHATAADAKLAAAQQNVRGTVDQLGSSVRGATDAQHQKNEAETEAAGVGAKYNSTMQRTVATLNDVYAATEANYLKQLDFSDAQRAATKVVKDYNKAKHTDAQTTSDDLRAVIDVAQKSADRFSTADGKSRAFRDTLVAMGKTVKKGSALYKEIQDFIAQLDNAAKTRTATIRLNVVNAAQNLGERHGLATAALPPHRAAGGSVAAGMPYTVGERGPETFIPGSAGRIIPSGAGGVVVQQLIVNNTGPELDEQAIVRGLQRFQRANARRWQTSV